MTIKELKTAKKERGAIKHDYGMKIEALESKLKNLSEWKAEKIAEEKKLRKKFKAIEERVAMLAVAKMKLERESKLRVVTHHKDCQTDSHPDGYDSVAVEDEKTIDENLNQVDASELPVNTSKIPICLNPQNWKTTNMDPTLLTTMRLNADNSGTNSLVPISIEQEPARSTPIEERRLIQELLEGFKKNTQNLSNKMHESHMRCLDIKNILDKKSSRKT